jgi:hypothetical protein
VVTLDCLLVWLAKDCSDGERLIVPTGNVADAVALLITSPQLVAPRIVGNVLLIAGVDVWTGTGIRDGTADDGGG